MEQVPSTCVICAFASKDRVFVRKLFEKNSEIIGENSLTRNLKIFRLLFDAVPFKLDINPLNLRNRKQNRFNFRKLLEIQPVLVKTPLETLNIHGLLFAAL
jgi:hypothetical protein